VPTPVRRALLSVSDKTGIVEFARELRERGIELLSTGGTAKLLTSHGIPVKEVAEHTGFSFVRMVKKRLRVFLSGNLFWSNKASTSLCIRR